MGLDNNYNLYKRDEFLREEKLSLEEYRNLLLLDLKMCEQLLRHKTDIDGKPLSDCEIYSVEKFQPLFQKELDLIENMEEVDEEESEELTFTDFDKFKTETIIKEQSGLFHIYELQKLAYRLTKGIFDTGVDSYGNTLTPDELEHLKKILKQIEMNLASLEGESND